MLIKWFISYHTKLQITYISSLLITPKHHLITLKLTHAFILEMAGLYFLFLSSGAPSMIDIIN